MQKSLLIAISLLSTIQAFAFEPGVWKSDYSAGHNTYTLQTFEDNTYVITIDPNLCGFDRLGNISVSTKMGAQVIDGTMTIVPVSAPRDTLVYSLEGTIDLEIVDKLSSRAKGFVRLIKLSDKANPVSESIRLFRQ